MQTGNIIVSFEEGETWERFLYYSFLFVWPPRNGSGWRFLSERNTFYEMSSVRILRWKNIFKLSAETRVAG